jgi:hypothetical protein
MRAERIGVPFANRATDLDPLLPLAIVRYWETY